MPFREQDLPPRRGMAEVYAEEAEHDEARRRERGETARGVDGPTACAICGGGVLPDEGRTVGPWREHIGCADSRAVLATLTGDRRVTEDEAAEVWRRLGGVPEYRRHRQRPGGPWPLPGVVVSRGKVRKPPPGAWEHVGEDDRATLRATLADVRTPAPAPRRRRNKRGPCGWCGVVKSYAWTRPGRWCWADGSPVVLCDTCATAWRTAGRPSQLARESWCSAALGLIVGGRPQLAWRALGVRVLCDDPQADRRGSEVPWSFLPRETVRAAKLATIGKFPGAALNPGEGEAWAGVFRAQDRQARRRWQAEHRAAQPVPW